MKVHELRAMLEGYHPDLDVVVSNGFITVADILDVVVSNGFITVADILPHPTFTTGNPWNSARNRFGVETDTPILVLNLSIDLPFKL